MIGELGVAGITLWGIGGWLLYFYERQRSRDYVADLVQVVYDQGLDRDDLRRSLEWDEVADRVDRWEGQR
jgi:hypothetical protein